MAQVLGEMAVLPLDAVTWGINEPLQFKEGFGQHGGIVLLINL
jgi:hypothetical protein